MRLFASLLFTFTIYMTAFSQEPTAAEPDDSSPVAYVLISMLVIGLIIYMLLRRQKRKFND